MPVKLAMLLMAPGTNTPRNLFDDPGAEGPSETLSSAPAQGVPYAASCTVTTNENLTAKLHCTGRARAAALHRATQGTTE